ncbi:Bdr family repetitive protein, partial [Borreliella bissettiae]
MESVLATNITEEQIYKEFLRLGMEQLIAQDLSKRYYHNELTYRDLENLEKQFG